MRICGWLLAALLTGSIAGIASAKVSDPNILFNEAVRLDLSGDAEASRAFALYREAAEAGLPSAQFNVGVMFDSGRGTAQNLPQAAIWYARAAAHGNQRAAYNLGQLYETGQGVPKNIDVARAWFEASELPAARSRVATLAARNFETAPLTAPTCVSPLPGVQLRTMAGVELVWIASPQREAVRFFVELRFLKPSGSEEVFSGFTGTTSVFAPLHELQGQYMWRVLAVARRAGNYVATDWSHFSLASD